MLKIAVIPAKSNSRRLPGKNMRILGNKPLFVHSVETALNSAQVDKVIVSSDSDEILDIAEKIGAVPVKRPIALCGDHVPNLSVCAHVVDELTRNNHEIDFLALLQPTHPFRTSSGLDEAVKILSDNSDFDSLTSVAPTHRARGVLVDNLWCQEEHKQRSRAQTKKNTYEITGHLFVLRVKNTIKRQSLFGDRVYAWVLPEPWLDIDIDTENDFIIAQAVKSA